VSGIGRLPSLQTVTFRLSYFNNTRLQHSLAAQIFDLRLAEAEAALAGALALVERGEDALHRPHPGAEIANRQADRGRRAVGLAGRVDRFGDQNLPKIRDDHRYG
jgi:hypothetical protein